MTIEPLADRVLLRRKPNEDKDRAVVLVQESDILATVLP